MTPKETARDEVELDAELAARRPIAEAIEAAGAKLDADVAALANELAPRVADAIAAAQRGARATAAALHDQIAAVYLAHGFRWRADEHRHVATSLRQRPRKSGGRP